MERDTVSITLWGHAIKKANWCEWYEEMKKVF